MEKRRFIRHPLSYPLRTRVIGEEHAAPRIESVSENISEGGLQFRSRRSLPMGAELELDLDVEKRSFQLDGTVVRCSRKSGGDFAVAVAFHSPNELLKARMMEQVVRIELFKQRLERRYGKICDFSQVAGEWIKRYSAAFAKRYNV
jgi:hypothetical protein